MNRATVLVAAFCLTACSYEPDNAQLNVSGVVRSAGGAPVPSATVQLISVGFKTSDIRATTLTDGNGRYTIRAYDSGCHASSSSLTLYVAATGKMPYYSALGNPELECTSEPQEYNVVLVDG